MVIKSFENVVQVVFSVRRLFVSQCTSSISPSFCLISTSMGRGLRRTAADQTVNEADYFGMHF